MSCKLFPLAALISLLTMASGPSKVYVALWFDTEDYIAPASDDAAKRLAEWLTSQGIKATFKVVGEVARTLQRRGRQDVIRALSAHDIGYHTNYHSVQPTMAVYLSDAGWEEGAFEFARREEEGVRDIERIFGVTPSCYGQPGSSWGPQVYPVLKRLGINLYLDEGSHVGLNGQPFWYCGLLHVFNMREYRHRVRLDRESDLARAKEDFKNAYERLLAQGGGVISIYYHPNEFSHRQFWDAINFSRGKNPPRQEWIQPQPLSAAESELAYRIFFDYISYIKSLPNVEFVTGRDIIELYADGSRNRAFSRQQILSLARRVQNEITFEKVSEDVALSAAEMFSLLSSFAVRYIETGDLPAMVGTFSPYGPTRKFAGPKGGESQPTDMAWHDFASACRQAYDHVSKREIMPSELWIGVKAISPEDFLATLGRVVEQLITEGRAPSMVRLVKGNFTASKHVAEDSAKLWSWIIFPEDFSAPKLMELAKLQAWTLKPAILRGPRR